MIYVNYFPIKLERMITFPFLGGTKGLFCYLHNENLIGLIKMWWSHKTGPHQSLFFFFLCLQLHLQHMEVPRPGVELELQLRAATPDLSHIYGLHCSLWQCQILNQARPEIKSACSGILHGVLKSLSHSRNSPFTAFNS